MTKRSPFHYFKTCPEIIRLAVMMYVRFPLSLRNVEDLLNERGIDISHEMVDFGGTDLAQYLPQKFARIGSARCAHIQIGGGTWMRCS
jgi:transposase-like protein